MLENFIKKIWLAAKTSLPIGVFCAFLIIIFILGILQYKVENIIFELLKYVIGVCLGGFITYYVQTTVEKSKRKTLEFNAACHVIRTHADQYIQMINLKKDLEDRMELLKSMEIFSRDRKDFDARARIIQDINEKIYEIDRDQLNSLPFPKQGREEFEICRSHIFLSNRCYSDAICSVLKLNSAKIEHLNSSHGFIDNGLQLPSVLGFLKNHIPNCILTLEDAIEKNKRYSDSFKKELRSIFGKNFKCCNVILNTGQVADSP